MTLARLDSQGAKCVNIVDLVKTFQTRVYSQKSALIQPRTGPSKFARNLLKNRKQLKTVRRNKGGEFPAAMLSEEERNPPESVAEVGEVPGSVPIVVYSTSVVTS